MTLISRILSLFPLLHASLILVSLFLLLREFSLWRVFFVLFVIYLFPLTCFWIHKIFLRKSRKFEYLDQNEYIPWWGEHKFQVVFIHFSFFEEALILIPGLFSLWLRAWGSKIGSKIHWSPALKIMDRHLLEIGDQVIIGYQVQLSAHVIKKNSGRLILYQRKNKIGANSLIGACSRIAPGTLIQPNSNLPACFDLGLNEIYSS